MMNRQLDKRENKKIWWFFEYIKNEISVVTIVIEEKHALICEKYFFFEKYFLKYYAVLMSGYREYGSNIWKAFNSPHRETKNVHTIWVN